ncbi:MAG: N-acetylglucosamine-6-phosphate deacetylase [Solobacterium sp.]|nr:N-acetylglucosamine-6-phosphate deacetylase [Solobacterium sp.]
MLIKSEKVWCSDRFLRAVVQITDSRISAILPYESEADIDYGSNMILPGFIDIHTHGAFGFDTNTGDPDGLKYWKEHITHDGVTSFLPTTVTDSKSQLKVGLKNVAAIKKQHTKGADILGIHFEGPYLDMTYRGAQPPEAIAKASVDEFKEYQEAAEGLIRIITLAPEHDTDFALTKYCAANGVIVSLGHSGASFDTACLAAANGAKSFTHTFNGMSGFTHRNNNMVGAALRLDDMYAEIICDCNHCTPEALNLFFRCKPKDKAIMISDSLMCKGFKPGDRFMFANHEVEIYPDGSAHLVVEKNLAGSTMKTNEGLRNLVERALVPFDAAVNSCTINPATLLGVNDHIGKIKTGYDADLAVLDDRYEVIQTYCKGQPQF